MIMIKTCLQLDWNGKLVLITWIEERRRYTSFVIFNGMY